MNTQEIDVNVRNLTKGKGVEVIISCLNGKYLRSSVNSMGVDCRAFYLGSTKVEDKESVGGLCVLLVYTVYLIMYLTLINVKRLEK